MRLPRILATPRKLAVLVGFIALPQAAGAIGSFFTFRAVAEWYPLLEKPPLNPPSWVFGPVWTTLYLLMGIAAYAVWRTPATPARKRAAYAAFGIQLVLNALWSVAFFGLRSPGWGLAVIAALAVAIVTNVVAFRRISRGAAALLVPYLAWVLFASYLNLAIFLRN